MKKTSQAINLILALSTLAITLPATAAEWTVPLTVTAGTASTSLTLGIAPGGTNGYDPGLDAPTPFTGSSLDVAFKHPEWNLIVAGSQVTNFHRDIRGSLPQTYSFQVSSNQPPAKLSWDSVTLPQKSSFALTDTGNSSVIDMKKAGSYSFSPLGARNFTIAVSAEDLTPPNAPTGLSYTPVGAAIYLTWAANSETDLAGYKVYFGNEFNQFTRSVDVKDVNNYNLMNLTSDIPYYIAVTAYDTAGNESPLSEDLIVKVLLNPSAIPIPDGDVDGDGTLSIIDVMKVLRFSYGLDTPTADQLTRADVSPLVNGVPQPDGVIRLEDAMLLLRKLVGLISF
jgi:hypothetical protein